MEVAALALLHSPLTSAAAWGALPAELAAATGATVVAVEVPDDREPPFAARYVASAARQLAAMGPGGPVVLVAHSGAGPLLPALAFARRAAHAAASGYVLVDAALPRPGGTASRLDLVEAEDAGTADRLRSHLEAGGRYPEWSDGDLERAVPEPGDRALLLATLRPRGLDWFTEPLPFPGDWPDAPCGYLRTSEPYDVAARVAQGRGWPVERTDDGHFAALARPARTAAAIRELLTRM